MNDKDTVISTQNKIIDRLSEANREMREYITKYGYCGYIGTHWLDEKKNCSECSDKDHCGRRNLLMKWG